jgi:hypothetical protein
VQWLKVGRCRCYLFIRHCPFPNIMSGGSMDEHNSTQVYEHLLDKHWTRREELELSH